MRSSRLILVVLLSSYLALAYFYVPRLTNCLWSDVEFSGWVAPVAHRMASGEHIYRDFTLPLSPASFMILAAVQKVTGRFLFLHELWVCALSNLIMVGLGYAIVRPFTSARNALLATVLAAPVIIATPKEIAYDQTAQVVAWASLAAWSRALTVGPGRRRQRWLVGAAFLASFTLAFKSSTGTGAVLGALAGLALIVFISWRRGGLSGAKAHAADLRSLLLGLIAGAVATMGMVLLAGGALGEFLRVVFVDGPRLKGGHERMVMNLISYAVFQPPVHISLLVAAFLAWLLVRIVRRKQEMLVEEACTSEEEDLGGRSGAVFTAAIIASIVVVVGMAIALLASFTPTIPALLRTLAGVSTVPAAMALLSVAILLVSNAAGARTGMDHRAAFAATVASAGVISLMHNLSDPAHRPFTDNNPIIPLAFTALMVLLDSAAAYRLKYVVFGLTMFGLFGDKFQRFLDARHPVDDPFFWHGLRVSDNGLKVLRAAQRARELAGRDGTVLMLPEDPPMVALVGRARPRLAGAVIFVDQYPEHVLSQDQAALEASLPDVVILHPSDDRWQSVYALWARTSPASTLQLEFLRNARDRYYVKDSTYDTWFWNQPSQMDVLVKRPGVQRSASAK